MDDVHEIVALGEQITGKPARKSGEGYRLPCWFHGGKNYNLSISPGSDRILLHCHSMGCDPKDLMESLGLSIKDIYYQPLNKDQSRQYKATTTDRQLKKEMEFELLILLCWISDNNQLLFPIGEHDKERVLLAMNRINKATFHYLKVGV